MTKIKLEEVFTDVKGFLHDVFISAIETGCAHTFRKENFPYLSTPNIVKYLIGNSSKGGILHSIDDNKNHIKLCSEYLTKEGLLNSVIFHCGESIDEIKEIVKKDKSNFFWLDSREDEDHGLIEYILASVYGKRPFIICIGDYGSEGSVKWKKSSEFLKKESDKYTIYNTFTRLIVGYFK